MKALLITITVLALLVLPVAAFAANIITVSTNDFGSLAFDADTVTAINEPPGVFAHVVTYYYYTPAGVQNEISKRQKAGSSVKGWKNLKYRVMVQKYQLTPANYCTFSSAYYDVNGQLLEQNDFKATMRAVPAGSAYEQLHDAIFAWLGY